MQDSTFEQTLGKYAEVVVRVGLNLQPGQRLLIRNAPFEAAPLVRLIAMHAYQAGARYVDVIWEDEQLSLVRYQSAPRDSFEEVPAWKTDVAFDYGQQGDALLTILAPNPDLMVGQDPELLAKVQMAGSRHFGRVLELIAKNATNWLVISVPTSAWSAKVLPDVPPAEREARLWDIIFEMCRIRQDDPVQGWRTHIQDVRARSEFLTHKGYAAIRYCGQGTNVTTGLPAGHIWHSAGLTSQNRILFTPNIPYEKTSTMPHRDQVNGVVTSIRPLVLRNGALIENFCLTFEEGRVVKAVAEKGEPVLQRLLDTDEGARRLGEVSLVALDSAAARSGLFFYNALYDEQVYQNIALGNAYRFSMERGEAMSDSEFLAAGGNQSSIHVDFMIGSDEMDVDGVTHDGAVEPVMRGGQWAFGL